jgi:hypothetical protein
LVDSDKLAQELGQLRKGAAMRHPRLADRLGPQTKLVFEITDRDNVAIVRQKIDKRVRSLLTPHGDELLIAALAALALLDQASQPRLIDRQRWLATTRYFDVRTARRRIDQAFALLVDAITETELRRTTSHPVEDGWSVLRFGATWRLDTPGPQLHEVRTISVTADTLDTVVCRLSVPPAGAGTAPPDIQAEVRGGGELVSAKRLSASHFEFTLALPKQLRRGDTHEYDIVFTLPDGHPMRPHYIYNPLSACDEFDLTVHFDPAARPTRLWRLSGLPLRVVDDEGADDDLLPLPPDARVVLAFRQLRQGFAYGVKWSF